MRDTQQAAVDAVGSAEDLRALVQQLAAGADDDATAACQLAAAMQRLATASMSSAERAESRRLAGLVSDPDGRHFTMAFTDQALRAQTDARLADQLRFLLRRFGVPSYLSWWERLRLGAFRSIGHLTSRVAVPLVRRGLQREVARVVLPAEPVQLDAALAARRARTRRLNLNHLGEAILGEREAAARLQSYLTSLERRDLHAVSIKVSSIASHLELLAFEHTLERLVPRLRALYRAAMAHPLVASDGSAAPKLVTLDMEAFEDLELTLALFQRVLGEPEFHSLTAGIVVQAYLPDSVALVDALERWACDRVATGGAPIHIRLVKGANLMMERVDAAHHGWSQAPYPNKGAVDANFKRLVERLLRPRQRAAVALGVGSHNVFDIAYALIVATRRGVRNQLTFEMLEGIAGPIRRVVEDLVGDVLLYAPTVASSDVQSALAYLMRRLDENTAADNFLRHSFGVEVGSETWTDQEQRFVKAWRERSTVPSASRRHAWTPPTAPSSLSTPFANEPDTDWSVATNRSSVHAAIALRKSGWPTPLGCVVDGQQVPPDGHVDVRNGGDPSRPGVELYRFGLVGPEGVERALACASAATAWSETSVQQRAEVLGRVAVELGKSRFELIASMVADAGKSIHEADIEVSEAIDFAEYYRRSAVEWCELDRVQAKPLGVVVVVPPWNFPLAIPAGGVLAALAAGNRVILKPALETVAVAWELAQRFWSAGVDRRTLQLVVCDNDPAGSALVSDPRVGGVILTGSTATARKLMGLRPDLWLLGETGGKNALIVTQMADVDQAIKCAVGGAFGHSGQKCSATSLLIVEASLFDDVTFRERLSDAVNSLPVGSSWQPESIVTPLIREPAGPLRDVVAGTGRGDAMSGTWLVAPAVAPDNPRLVSPGVRWGIAPGGFLHTTELFGPVLGVLRADSLDHALALANGTGYGLTAGLMSLDLREQERFIEAMDAGCLYINRKTTGAIVERQPFGGRHASVFGPGAKAGGPAYISQLLRFEDVADAPDDYAEAFRSHYAVSTDVTGLLGQDNHLRYQPHPGLTVHAAADASAAKVQRVCDALAAINVAVRWSCSDEDTRERVLSASNRKHSPIVWSDEALCAELRRGQIGRLRLVGSGAPAIYRAAADAGTCLDDRVPVAAGRVELLRYLQPQTISNDYHRFGNLGDRDTGAGPVGPVGR